MKNKQTSFLFIMIVYILTACTSLQFEFDTTEEIQNAIRPHHSTLTAYELTAVRRI